MSTVLKLKGKKGAEILIEASPAAGFERQGAKSAAGKVQEALDSCAEAVSTLASTFAEKIHDAASKVAPQEIELCLALKAAGGSNWIIASGSAEANIQLKITWKL